MKLFRNSSCLEFLPRIWRRLIGCLKLQVVFCKKAFSVEQNQPYDISCRLFFAKTDHRAGFVHGFVRGNNSRQEILRKRPMIRSRLFFAKTDHRALSQDFLPRIVASNKTMLVSWVFSTWLLHTTKSLIFFCWAVFVLMHYRRWGEVGGWGRDPFSRNFMKPTPRRKWYLTTGRRFH